MIYKTIFTQMMLNYENHRKKIRDKNVYLHHGDVRMHFIALGFVFAAAGPYRVSLEWKGEI